MNANIEEEKAAMRARFANPPELDTVAIEDININLNCRDDMLAVLLGIQQLLCDREAVAEVQAVLDRDLFTDVNRALGRPGMAPLQILILALLKQGLNCDYDRLHDLANEHQTLRMMLGHGPVLNFHRYRQPTMIANISQLSHKALKELNVIVVRFGHKLLGLEPEAPLQGRCDSFVVETNVHHPSDVNLWLDAVCCAMRETSRVCKRYGVGSWTNTMPMKPKPRSWRKCLI